MILLVSPQRLFSLHNDASARSTPKPPPLNVLFRLGELRQFHLSTNTIIKWVSILSDSFLLSLCVCIYVCLLERGKDRPGMFIVCFISCNLCNWGQVWLFAVENCPNLQTHRLSTYLVVIHSDSVGKPFKQLKSSLFSWEKINHYKTMLDMWLLWKDALLEDQD